jgi:hypothetical protein
MAASIPPTFQTAADFWAWIRKEALRQWNADPSLPSWDLIEHHLSVKPGSPLATLAAREQTAAIELRRLASALKPIKRRVRATVKRIGPLPHEALSVGPNETALRTLLALPSPTFFPKNDLSAVVIAFNAFVRLQRSVRPHDLALAALLLGHRPNLGDEGHHGWSAADVIDIEQGNMQKAAKRVAERDMLSSVAAPEAMLLLHGNYLQATPGIPAEPDHAQSVPEERGDGK